MIKKIDDNIFCISLTMGRISRTTTSNCYLIKGDNRSLLIDPGYLCDENRITLLRALQKLEVNLDGLDIFITHAHADHSGLLETVASINSNIYIHSKEWDVMLRSQENEYWEAIKNRLVHNGWPVESELGYKELNFIPLHKIDQLNIRFVEDGSFINVDDKSYECVSLPGHTDGQMGLLDKRKNYLFSGDLVLNDSYPNIYTREAVENIQSLALKSLAENRVIKACLLLTGHGEPISQPEVRCNQTKNHYLELIEKVFNLVKSHPNTAYALSERCFSKRWDTYNSMVRIFLMGEVLACAEYLVSIDRLASYEEGQKVVYINR